MKRILDLLLVPAIAVMFALGGCTSPKSEEKIIPQNPVESQSEAEDLPKEKHDKYIFDVEYEFGENNNEQTKISKKTQQTESTFNTVENIYIEVLQNNIGFYHVRHVYDNEEPTFEYAKLEDILNDLNSYEDCWEFKNFTLINVNGSDVPAVVLELYPVDERIVLHYNEGVVYGYDFPFRGMRNIMTDGTFDGSGGAYNTYIMELHFLSGLIETITIGKSDTILKDDGELEQIFYINEEEVTRELWQDFLNEQSEKEIALWYEFSNKTIAEDFASAWSNYSEY